MTSHAKLSPSSRVRWAQCPASVREAVKYPPKPSGPASIAGTHTHTVLEHCIKAGAASAKSMVGVKMKDHEGEFVVDAEQASRVDMALDYVNNRVQEILITEGVPAVVLAESSVDPAFLIGRSDCGGTVDIQIISKHVHETIDYKDGMDPVPVENNPQLEMYGLGALARYKLPVNATYPVDTMRLTIIQPKLITKGMPPITSYDQPVSSLLGKISQVVREAAATDAPDAPFVPGKAQCKYCPANGGCTALVNQAMESSGISFQNLDVAKEAAAKEPTEMSDAQIKEIVESAPLIRSMLEAVEAEALRRFEAGKTIEGLKAVRGNGQRSWAFDDEVIAEKLKKMGVPKDEIYKTSVVSIAKVLDTKGKGLLSWEATKAGTKVVKTLSDKQLALIVNEYTKKGQGKLIVVPLSDDRPAVTLNAAPMFAPVAETVADTLPSWMT